MHPLVYEAAPPVCQLLNPCFGFAPSVLPPPCRYDQPYQVALYNLGVLCEAKRW